MLNPMLSLCALDQRDQGKRELREGGGLLFVADPVFIHGTCHFLLFFSSCSHLDFWTLTFWMHEISSITSLKALNFTSMQAGGEQSI
jgi:hypothetical protein